MKKLFQRVTIITLALIFFGCTSPVSLQPRPLNQIQGINKHTLMLAERAYEHAKIMGYVKKPYLIIVDFSKPSTEKRLWLVNMKTQHLLLYTYVAHGKNTGYIRSKYFSNKINSLKSSIGVMVTGNSYHGSVGYSMRLHGLEPGFNNNVYTRLIVVHGASYVGRTFVRNHGYLGRTLGCFAINTSLVKNVIDLTHNGSILFAYYPDKTWLNKSLFLKPLK